MSNLDLDAILGSVPGAGGVREDIERRARLHATLSHYAMLRVPTDASTATVTAAWESVDALCNPTRLAQDLSGLTNEPWTVYARSFAAFAVLSDDGHRRAYDEVLAATSGTVDRGSEHTRVFGAESNAERAEAAMRNGDAFGAERLAAEAVHDDPEMVGYVATLAAAHVSRGTEASLQQALTVLEACVAHDPQFERAHVARARIYRRMGREIEAHIEYERALKINPENADALRELDAPPPSVPRSNAGSRKLSSVRPPPSGRAAPRSADAPASSTESARRSGRPPAMPTSEEARKRTFALLAVLAIVVVIGVGVVVAMTASGAAN